MKSNFEKTLQQLNAPYKKVNELINNSKRTCSGAIQNPSVFWNLEVGYVSKYKNVSTKKTNQKEQLNEEQGLGR